MSEAGAGATAPEAAPKKLGLALSGGGFRAALFHVGVLARLAELGILRRVEVISTVSGGSIIGALYYIHVRTLLQTKSDAEIGDADYVELLERIHRDFLDAVQTNVRARTLLNLAKNVVMIAPDYSRSDRIGDLYDRHFYKPAWPEPRPKKRWGIERQIELRELLIEPKDDPNAPFRPDEHNGPRSAKVPVLLINATTLNTGHNWRFEVVRMGEPPPYEPMSEIADDIDKNRRLAQGYFTADEEGDPPHRALASSQRDFPLGLAVAASACVPTLFHPLAVSKLYPDISAELVDGGVHDNQGVQALFDTGCTHLIVSDASGQLEDANYPATRVPGVGGRSISIYGDRIRDEQLLHAFDRREPVALMHLRKGLLREVVNPLADDGQPVVGASVTTEAGGVSTEAFGVDREVQRLLSRVRTDLDAFSDVEAHSLMLDGYLMTDHVVANQPVIAGLGSGGAPPVDPVPETWQFRAVSNLIRPRRPGEPPTPEWYRRRLEVAQERLFKVLLLLRALKVAMTIVVGAGVLAALYFGWRGLAGVSWGGHAVVLTIVALLVLLVAYLWERPPWGLVRDPLNLIGSAWLPLLAAPFAWVFSILTFLTGKLYLRLGKVRPD